MDCRKPLAERQGTVGEMCPEILKGSITKSPGIQVCQLRRSDVLNQMSWG